jgi:hypothetical protein
VQAQRHSGERKRRSNPIFSKTLDYFAEPVDVHIRATRRLAMTERSCRTLRISRKQEARRKAGLSVFAKQV